MTHNLFEFLFSQYIIRLDHGHKLMKEMLHFFFKSVNSELFLYAMVDSKEDSHDNTSNYG